MYIKLVLNINSKVLLEIPQCGNKRVTRLVRELDQEIVCNYIFKIAAAKEMEKKKLFHVFLPFCFDHRQNPSPERC